MRSTVRSDAPSASPLLVGPTPVFLVGALTASVILYVWGSLAQIPHWHDEASYLLQAGIFARGHWSAPPPALPEFFQQLYVLFSPVLASKYPPGTRSCSPRASSWACRGWCRYC